MSSFSLVQGSLKYLLLQSLNSLQIDLEQFEKIFSNILVKRFYSELLGETSVFRFLKFMRFFCEFNTEGPSDFWGSVEFWHIWITVM